MTFAADEKEHSYINFPKNKKKFSLSYQNRPMLMGSSEICGISLPASQMEQIHATVFPRFSGFYIKPWEKSLVMVDDEIIYDAVLLKKGQVISLNNEIALFGSDSEIKSPKTFNESLAKTKKSNDSSSWLIYTYFVLVIGCIIALGLLLKIV